jgi:hypothetical protein
VLFAAVLFETREDLTACFLKVIHGFLDERFATYARVFVLSPQDELDDILSAISSQQLRQSLSFRLDATG